MNSIENLPPEMKSMTQLVNNGLARIDADGKGQAVFVCNDQVTDIIGLEAVGGQVRVGFPGQYAALAEAAWKSFSVDGDRLVLAASTARFDREFCLTVRLDAKLIEAITQTRRKLAIGKIKLSEGGEPYVEVSVEVERGGR